VFHHISSADSPFTRGINVRTSPDDLEAALRFITSHYKPVRLDDVLSDGQGRGLPPRAILVTFDDAYASVAAVAAPLCEKYRVPAVFFVNAAFLDNRELAPDNLVCYVANTQGIKAINDVAREIQGQDAPEMHSLADVFGRFLPSLALSERRAFVEALQSATKTNGACLAADAGLYLSASQLRNLTSPNFEIGNHTRSHVHCRLLSGNELVQEIDNSKTELENVSGAQVRAFSVPYGSSVDLTPELGEHLKQTGHQAAFLSESVANFEGGKQFVFDRVNPRTESDEALFFEIEILPRMRAVRNRLLRRSGTSRLQNAISKLETKQGIHESHLAL
jgi:peptidoglycan/xylan/chitin deacetylase (PgdA/CDA1 family)